MRTIWKFLLPIDDHSIIEMPHLAEVLSVQTQTGEPCIWAICDPDAVKEQRHFCIRGTGHPLNGLEGKFIGTFQMHDGALVFHLFEHIELG